MTKIKTRFVTAILISLAFSSCVPVKRIAYVQSDTQLIFHGEPADIGIRPGDEIYVRISSADEQPVNFTGEGQRTTGCQIDELCQLMKKGKLSFLI
jgi:hypothetical protein